MLPCEVKTAFFLRSAEKVLIYPKITPTKAAAVTKITERLTTLLQKNELFKMFTANLGSLVFNSFFSSENRRSTAGLAVMGIAFHKQHILKSNAATFLCFIGLE